MAWGARHIPAGARHKHSGGHLGLFARAGFSATMAGRPVALAVESGNRGQPLNQPETGAPSGLLRWAGQKRGSFTAKYFGGEHETDPVVKRLILGKLRYVQ